MKKYTTEEINAEINKPSWNDENLFSLDKESFKNWMIDKGERKEDKPLNAWYKWKLNGEVRFWGDDNQSFGFNYKGRWLKKSSSNSLFQLTNSNWQPCPESEWQAMLIKEAEKKGYNQTNYKCLNAPDYKAPHSGNYYIHSGNVWQGLNSMSFSDKVFDGSQGHWAEIIEQPSIPEYTMEEAISKIGHEFKLIK